MTIGILFILFFILMLIGVPIGISIGISALMVIFLDGNIPMLIVPQKMFLSINSFTLLAIPFFMLAGSIMDKSGITEKLVNFANAAVGWLKGGMSYVSIFAGMLMGGISGSAPADTAALSSVLIPSMKRLGYGGSFAAAVQAASGSIGIIIPPSIPMVVLGGIANISVGALFLGGILPGILVGLTFMIFSRYICIKYSYGVTVDEKFSLKNLFETFKAALLPMMAPIIIIGGILGGVFTPTEASVVVVIYTLFLGMVIYRTIKLKDLGDIFLESVVSSANVMLIIAASSLFSWILIRNNFPQLLSSFLFSISQSPIFILFMINLILYIGGMFIEGIALIIMFVPILLPLATSVGIDPILFGVMCIFNIAIGTLTPPVGVCLFVASSSAGVKLEESAKMVIPFIAAMIIDIVLILVFPSLVKFLPYTLLK